MSPSSLANARIDGRRFWSTIERSAAIGTWRHGLNRLTLSDADKAIRDQFVEWCGGAGLAVRIDEVGNIFGRRAGRDDHLAPVLLGSHLDTQANGGRFDGIVGVLGALELVRTLNDLGHVTRRPIEIVNWTNEEGARFSPPMVASGCFAGVYERDWVYGRTADDGATLGGELVRIGYRGEVPVGGVVPDSYLELHIEQGPILDAERLQVGVVTHGYTSHGMLVEFRGETAHTGPWPMQSRRSALVAGARLVAAVDDIGWDFAHVGGKASAPRLQAWPNRAGILSEWAQVVCDVRQDDPVIAGIMAERVQRAVGEAAARAGCTCEILDRWNWGGRIFDEAMVELVRDTAASLGYSHRDVASQAGHDAYFLARICPTAMIFTPCRGGITHNDGEDATLDELIPGVNVLLHAAVARADR
ncbi:Zn-dependent hydrolase [Chelatococcus reniformis]|uniref:Zn-dependent hydrolase n=1 Tax=Chelatococcus reniformis TaxID=1494448 RepID=A0A916U842_9HYPH|nr:Zn-dependent hydrolase [Chelatococcus reniformis]GGC63827.1 Zn-dependent hydrolase [Chelatococcus reniformis]